MKKFNKLLNKSKKSDDADPPSSSRPASANVADARAQYYASRQGSNPFGDDHHDHPTTTTANNTAKNPFGDDSSDDEEDDALATFRNKKQTVDRPPIVGRAATAGAVPSPRTGADPFDGGNKTNGNPFDDEEDSSPRRGGKAASISREKTNPFEEESVADASSSRGKRGAAANSSSSSGNNSNPFAEKSNPFNDESSKNSSRPATTSRSATNPFGEESSSPSRPLSTPSSSGNKNNNPFDSPQQPRSAVKKPMEKTSGTSGGGSNPFDSPQRKQQQQQPTTIKATRDNVSSTIASSRPNQLTKSAAGGTASRPPPAPIPKPSISQRSMSHGQVDNISSFAPMNPAAATSGGAAAADKRKLWRGFGNHNNSDTDSTKPILERMDDETTLASSPQILQKGPTANAAGLASWLRLNKKEDEEVAVAAPPTAYATTSNKTHHLPPKSVDLKSKKRNSKKKCKAVITAWPFDNFHEIQEQQLMYEELASRAASDYKTINQEEEEYQSGGSSDDENKDEVVLHNNADAKYYERPEELVSIKEAVTNLPLVDFEKKAEERAINIVSTWLFDAGLIDELLVNGAMPAPPPPLSPDNRTIKSQEGVEIGQHGFPLLGVEGAELKMDKETNKLRGMIQRDLSIINARLNDGVAASGLEVQELVNAVAATKEDIGRLRELTTYISDGQMSDRDEFLLAKYPHLRKAINARRNINRCFRELEFFSQIPSTCDRLRDELHGGEWTEEEWSTIRNVAMEHVELEIMLVEAEVSMKGGRNFNDAMVDNFLDSHVQNVWELGDEIRMRMLSGIGSAFELAINNPAGMVALVEAVEVYEKAAESFEKKRQESTVEDSGKLRFTNMRAAALEQLYQDFELRGVEMFRGVHEQAADIAEEEDASNTQFTAVLKAATELVTEIDIVKHQMSPCFAPHWHVEALWSSCVAHVCSNHIVQQIGGPDGQNLPELTITQLLELVAWVEYFRETIEETFPEVSEMRDTKKTYFEERPDLFGADKRTVNMRNATDSLAWVNNMLWEVHRLAQEEFLVRTRSQTDEWLDKVYGSETVKNQSSEGKLTTSLCEDVFSFSSVQLRTIRERLSKKSDALILAVCVILSHMRSKQVHSRNNFLQDLETCCAASNDFTRMSEKCEDVCTDLISQCEFSEDMIATVEASSNELMAVYSSDAVYAARSVHIYVFDPIEEEIGTRLFEQAWEEDMVGNDLALSLIRTLEDFYDDLVHFMDDFMVVKSVMSLMSATVIFYVKCLLTRAETHRSNKKPYFGDVQTALNRMTGDIKVMREYFEGLVPKMPALKKNIEKDFEILSTVHELMSIAAGMSISEAEDFILVLQKRVRDVSITKHIVGDIWHLVSPTEERYVWELVESMEEQLVAIAPADDALALEVNDRSYVKGLRLDEMAVKLYVKSKRHRPVKSTATEKIINNWRTTWAVRAEDGIEDNKDVY